MGDINKMIAEIEAEVAFTRAMTGRKALDKRVMQAIRKVPRDKFVTEGMRHYAFDNGPLPIGYSQTISQPYIVALMTDLLEPDENDVVLEVGTGSGYQAAVLSLLVKKVYSMEVIKELGEEAAARLREQHYDNVETCIGNGYEGWPQHAPYDGIIVTAASSHIPQPLIDQLKCGGRMVIPIGAPYSTQNLMLVSKDLKGHITSRNILAVVFVPMVGEEAEKPL